MDTAATVVNHGVEPAPAKVPSPCGSARRQSWGAYDTVNSLRIQLPQDCVETRRDGDPCQIRDEQRPGRPVHAPEGREGRGDGGPADEDADEPGRGVPECCKGHRPEDVPDQLDPA